MVSELAGPFGLPYVHADAHAAAYDAAGNLYFGTDGGIFKSTDDGATFTDASTSASPRTSIYHLGSSTANRGGGDRRPAGQRHARARRVDHRPSTRRSAATASAATSSRPTPS